MINIKIKQEVEKDYLDVERVVEEAFENAEHTDHTEHLLVSRLRRSGEFIPELSMVARVGEQIVGHVMFTRMWVEGEQQVEVLALAPVSVAPGYQSKGVGSALIREGLEKAKELGFRGVIVLGHDQYYPRFGFGKASAFGIDAPFEVPDSAFMALEIVEDGLKGVSGVAVYSPAFME